MILGMLPGDTFLSYKVNPAKDMILGAFVAIEGFSRSVLKYGTFDEYHLFVSRNDPAYIACIYKYIGELGVDIKKIKVIEMEKLVYFLQKFEYTAFFYNFPGLYKFSYLRSKYAKSPFALCTMLHTVSYSRFLYDTFFEMMVSDIYPFDSLMCISRAQLTAIRNTFNLVSKSLKNDNGINISYKGRLNHLPLGIDPEKYNKVDKMFARSLLGISKDKVALLSFGRFSVYDKMDLYPLLTAFSRLVSENNNIMLILAGKNANDNYAAVCKKIVNELGLSVYVKFYVDISSEKKNLLYAACDIFISPSDNIQESFGLTILEAMASGMPVVASDWGSYKELVMHGKTGFLIPTYWSNFMGDDKSFFDRNWSWELDHLYLAQSLCIDVKKTIEYLSILVRNKDLRIRFGSKGRDAVFKKYSWPVLIPRYEKLWKSLAKQSKTYNLNRRKMGAFMPKYFETFSHYPSKFVNNKTQVSINNQGASIFRTKKINGIRASRKDIISVNTVFIILSFLIDKRFSTIGNIERYMEKISKSANTANIRFHIMWLLKKNYIDLKNR